MKYRAAKNEHNVIIAVGADENQSGNYPLGSSDQDKLGVWCEWTFEEFPDTSSLQQEEKGAMLFKENQSGDGIMLRTEDEIILSPDGKDAV